MKNRYKAVSHWLLDNVNTSVLFKALKHLGKPVKEIFHGYKVCEKSLGKRAIQQRFIRCIEDNPKILLYFANSAGVPWSSFCKAMPMISSDWLFSNWKVMVKSEHGGAWVFAFCSNKDEKIARLGSRLLGCPSIWGEVEGDCNKLPVSLQALIGFYSSHDEKKSKNQDEVVNLNHPRVQQELHKWKERYDKRKEEIKELEEKNLLLTKDSKNKERASRNEFRELRKSYDDLNGQMADTISSYKLEIDKRLLGMDHEFLRTSQLLQESNESLEEMISDALAEQLEANKKHGIRSELREQLASLKDLAEQMNNAIRESVLILPNIHSLRELLMHKIAEYQKIVDDEQYEEKTLDLVLELQLQIHAAAKNDNPQQEFATIQELLLNPVIVNYLGDEREGLQLSFSKQFDIYKKIKSQGELLKGDESGTTKSLNTRELWDLNRVLGDKQKREIVLIVDAYNVIKRIPELNQFEIDYDISVARKNFIKLCQNKSAEFANIELVFDGTEVLSSRETQGGVTVVFAAFHDLSQNADNYIVNQLRSSQEETKEVWLVSDDYGLRHQCEGRAHYFIPCRNLYDFLVGE